MKLVAGTVLLLAAEQAFAHAHLVQFPHQDVAARVLIPASLVLAVIGAVFVLWGLLTELLRPAPAGQANSGPQT